MQETLVIYVHALNPERPSWAIVSADGLVKQDEGQITLSELAKNKNVVVIVPAEEVLLTSVRLPKMNRTRLLQALPYALEEQLISDVEALHFAIGDYQPDTDLSVAIVSQEKMQHWQLLMQAWGVQADVLMPLTFALPYQKDEWQVLIHDMVVLRTGALQGVACDKENVDAVLKLAIETAEQKPVQIEVNNYHADVMPAKAGIQSNSLDASFRWHDKKESDFIPDVARQALKSPFINLLQGPYAQKKSRLPQVDNLTQKVFTLAKAVLLLLFLYPLGSLLILNHRVKSIDDDIASIYQRNFPQATSVVAPKQRMQEKLNKLEAQIGENRVLLLLGYVGNAMKETPGIKLRRLDFQNNQLTLELTASTSADFSAFTDFLTSKGLKLKQQNATLTGEHVNATVLIE